MKEITDLDLDSEQREKLKEMLEALFPEQVSTTIKNDWNVIDTQGVKLGDYHVLFPVVRWATETDYISFNQIHWFDFCMNHLAKKVINGFSFNSLYMNVLALGTNSSAKHPVDFLYEEFKHQGK